MVRRRRTLALVLLAAPLICAPIGLAVGKPTETLEGTLRTWHGDTFTTPVAVGAGIDTTVAGVVPLEAADPGVHALAGKRVRARGQRRADGVFAANGGVQAAGEGLAAAATGTKSVAVLLFNFSNNTAQPWTPSAVRGVVFDNTNSVDEYYRDASYGQLALSGDVFGWYTIDSSNVGCAYTTWASEARAKAATAGVSLAGYQYTVYAFPQTSSCGWAPRISGDGKLDQRRDDTEVASHEPSRNWRPSRALRSSGVPSTFSGPQPDEMDPFTAWEARRPAPQLARPAGWPDARRDDGGRTAHTVEHEHRACCAWIAAMARPQPRVPPTVGNL
jgi:hypothetical protein